MNVLESYLVSLQFSSDEPSFQKMRGILADSERAVTEHASGMTRSILEAQGAIVGTFTSISAAIIGVVDKSAMADQAWRLQGLAMLGTTEQARKLDLITKTLGVSLEQLVWDQELHNRAVIMGHDIDRWSKALGPDFEKNMKGVRDFRMEFGRLELAIEFLGMKFASDVFKKLFPNQDALKSLDSWITNFGDHIEGMSDKLSNYAVPVLKETWVIFKDLGEVIKEAGIAFTNVVGVFTGDSAIQGTTFDFDKFAGAIRHVATGFEELLHWIANAEKSLVHFASAMALALGGKFSQAAIEFKSGLKQLTESSAAAMGVIVPGSPADYARNSELGSTVAPGPAVIQQAEEQGEQERKAAAAQDQRRAESGISPLAITGDLFMADPKKIAADTLDYYKKQIEAVGAWKTVTGSMDILREYWKEFRTAGDEPMIQRMTAPAVSPGTATPGAPEAQLLMPKFTILPPVEAPATGFNMLQALAREMGKIEGFGVPGTIPTVNNNPGDIIPGKFATREGATGQAKGYAVFPDAETGFKAEIALLKSKIDKDASLTDLIAGNKLKGIGGWSPADAPGNTPESTQRYIDQLAKRLNIDPTIPLKAILGDLYGIAANSMTKQRGYDTPDLAPKAKLESWAVPETRDWKPQMQLIAAAQRPTAPSVSNSSNVQQSISLGGISVYITQPGADENQIRRAISEALKETFDTRSQIQLAQLTPQWS